MSSVQSIHKSSVKLIYPRFGVAKDDYIQYYRDFLKQKVFLNSLNAEAFFFIDHLRRKEPARKKRRMPLHDQLSLYLINKDFKALFPGLDVFVTELRQLLVAARKIPRFVGWIPFKGKPYRLDGEHKNMSPQDADDRLDSLRVAIIALAKEWNAAHKTPDWVQDLPVPQQQAPEKGRFAKTVAKYGLVGALAFFTVKGTITLSLILGGGALVKNGCSQPAGSEKPQETQTIDKPQQSP